MRQVYAIRPYGNGFAQVLQPGRVVEERVYYGCDAAQAQPKALASTDDLPEGKKNLYYTEERVTPYVSAAVTQALQEQEGRLTRNVQQALQGVLNSKADASALNLKADQSALDTMSGRVTSVEEAVALKAGRDEVTLGLAKKLNVDDFQNHVQTLANRSDLEQTTQDLRALTLSVAEKATKGQVSSLESVVASKADTSRVSALENQLSGKGTEIDAKLETKATVDALAQTNQNLTNLQAVVGTKASSEEVSNLTQQVQANKSSHETAISKLESKLTSEQVKGDEALKQELSTLDARVRGLVIPSWQEINGKLAERVSATAYEADRNSTAESLRGFRESLANEKQARLDGDRTLNQAVKDSTSELKAQLTELFTTRLADKPNASQVATDIRIAKQEVMAELKGTLLEKDSENDLALQTTIGQLQTLKASTEDRFSSVNEKLGDRPSRDAVTNMINSAVNAIPKPDLTPFATQGSLAQAQATLQQNISALDNRLSNHVAQNGTEHSQMVSKTELATKAGELNNVIATNKQWVQDQLNGVVSKTEFESRMGLINQSMQNVDLSNLTKYATIDYVQDQLRGLNSQGGDYASNTAVENLTGRVLALETSKPDLAPYATIASVQNTEQTLRGEITSKAEGIEARLVAASSSKEGLMSAADKAKLDALMTKEDVIALLRKLLCVEMLDQDQQVFGYLADFTKLDEE